MSSMALNVTFNLKPSSPKVVHMPVKNITPNSSIFSDQNHMKSKSHLSSILITSPPKFPCIFNHKHDSYPEFPLATTLVHKAVATDDIARPAKYTPPSFWDDTSFSADNKVLLENQAEDRESLKQEVRSMLMDKECKPEDKMILIDTIERLGLAYHFEQEIDVQIDQIYKSQGQNEGMDYDLYTTALHFRMFRQHGYDAPSSIFKKFKDDDGAFKKALTEDINSLLSLYEATYLKYQGDDILKEAIVFATHYLKQAEAMPLLDSFLKDRVARALFQPLHWGIPRVEARYYISFYEKGEFKNELLLKLAKLDYNLLQNLYREELREFLKWLKGFDLRSKLPYIRDYVVELYLVGMGHNFEPRYSLVRSFVTKNMFVLTIMNDLSDNSQATFEDIKNFLEVLQLQRWGDVTEIDRLPHHMQIACKFIFTTFEEYRHEMSKQGRSYAVSYNIEAVQKYANSLLTRSKWYVAHETPTFQDILANAYDNVAHHPMMASCLMGMESATMETFEWLATKPKFMEASGLYCRFMNNICTYEREHEASKFPNTSMDCYMKEYGASEEEAKAKFGELSEEAWMTMNKEWVSTNCVPLKEFMKLGLNYGRASWYGYGHGVDKYTYPARLKNGIAAVFINPFEID